MSTLSIAIIIKNESAILDRCLSCLSFANEIIIVDTGSTDNSKEIASKYGKVYDFEWFDDFSAARNYCFSLATGDYVMWLDADDILSEQSQQSIGHLDLTADCYYLPYQVAFYDDGVVSLEYYRERIVRASRSFKWHEPVHEYLAVSGDIQYLDIPIEHHPGIKESSTRNLDIYRNREIQGEEFTPRALYYYARELKDHQLWCEAMNKYQKFLQCPTSWVEDKISACIGLSEIYLVRNQVDDAMQALDQSFSYDLPRPEVCCRIANIYFDKFDYDKAIWWYHFALEAPKQINGFIFEDYNEFIPSIQLAVCYDRIGKRNRAIYYNEKAAIIKPNHKSVLHNRNYFKV